MYNVKQFLDIVNALIRGYTSQYDRFLDERRTEWVRQVELKLRTVPIASDDPDSQERLLLLNKIFATNEKYCRRDIEIPHLEYNQQIDRLKMLDGMRAQAGIDQPHQTILSTTATLLMLKGEYEAAKTSLEKAISINYELMNTTPSQRIMATKDCVRVHGSYVRCMYMLGDFDTAVAKADESREIAALIAEQDDEEGEWNTFSGTPNLEFVPAAVHAYFCSCDARIHHEKWAHSERMKREFTALWNDSITDFNVPMCWRTPTKISVLSDSMWVSRASSYVEDIARNLYIVLAPSAPSKVVRLVRSKWGGFELRFPKGIAAAVAGAALILIVILSDAVGGASFARADWQEQIEVPQFEVLLPAVRDALEETDVDGNAEKLTESILAYSSGFLQNKDLRSDGARGLALVGAGSQVKEEMPRLGEWSAYGSQVDAGIVDTFAALAESIGLWMSDSEGSVAGI